MRINLRRLWQYAIVLAMLVIIAGIAFTPSDVDSYARSMQRLMDKGDYAAALAVGDESDKSNRQLMQLRLDALNHEHLLGERLFAYPVVGKSSDYKGSGGDFELCCCLIDKDLDGFARLLPRYYKDMNSLPRYYREALILYSHQRAQPLIVYHDNVLDTDYNDMLTLVRKYPAGTERQMAVFSQYEGSYWYYYEFLNDTKKHKG